MHDRLEKEKAFHNEAFSKGIRKPLDAYYSIFGAIREEFRNRLQTYAVAKDALECGCGVNSYATELAPKLRRLSGIDISDEAVRQSVEMAKAKGLANCAFKVMNAEQLEFANHSFDLVFGVGIIHHLDLPVFYSEAARVLKPSGKMLFMEPLGYNPFINIYRKLTPKLRTPDEHPLLKKDLKLIKKSFDHLGISYYHFFTLLAVPFRNTMVFHPLLKCLQGVDDFMFRHVPGFKYLAWYVIIEAGEPKKNAPSCCEGALPE